MKRSFELLKFLRSIIFNTNVAAFFFWFVCFYWNCVLQAYSEQLARSSGGNEKNRPVLADLGFTITPRIHWDQIADIWVYTMVALTMARYFVTPMRWVIFRRHALLLGSLFFVRSFALVMTTLPNPQTTCVATAVGNPWIEAFYILTTRHKTCADMFYSGHAVNATICGLIWHHYSHVVPIFDWDPLGRWFRSGPVSSSAGDIQRATTVKLIVWYGVLIEFYLIIATRLHYTIDVFTGFALTMLAWKLYQHYIKTSHTRDNFFNRALCWFEKDSEDLKAWRLQQQLIVAKGNGGNHESDSDAEGVATSSHLDQETITVVEFRGSTPAVVSDSS